MHESMSNVVIHETLRSRQQKDIKLYCSQEGCFAPLQRNNNQVLHFFSNSFKFLKYIIILIC